MRFLSFLFVISTFSLFANQPDSLKTKKWAIGISYSPDYCYRVPYIKDGKEKTSNMTEKGKLGFTAGINVLYRLLDRVGIEFGVLYSTKGQKVNTPTTSWSTPGNYDSSIPNSGGSIYFTSPERKAAYSYQYIEIPLKINVYLINKRLKVFPSIGGSANIFVGKKINSTYTYADGHSQKDVIRDHDPKNIPNADFALLLGVGMSYDINKKMMVKLEPSYRTFIRPIIDGPVSGTFYSIGANAGVYFNF